MIYGTIEIREGALTHRVQATARPIERALKIAAGGKLGRRVHLVFSIDPETFVLADPGRREAACDGARKDSLHERYGSSS